MESPILHNGFQKNSPTIKMWDILWHICLQRCTQDSNSWGINWWTVGILFLYFWKVIIGTRRHFTGKQCVEKAKLNKSLQEFLFEWNSFHSLSYKASFQEFLRVIWHHIVLHKYSLWGLWDHMDLKPSFLIPVFCASSADKLQRLHWGGMCHDYCYSFDNLEMNYNQRDERPYCSASIYMKKNVWN